MKVRDTDESRSRGTSFDGRCLAYLGPTELDHLVQRPNSPTRSVSHCCGRISGHRGPDALKMAQEGACSDLLERLHPHRVAYVRGCRPDVHLRTPPRIHVYYQGRSSKHSVLKCTRTSGVIELVVKGTWMGCLATSPRRSGPSCRSTSCILTL